MSGSGGSSPPQLLCKYLSWFSAYLPSTNRVFIMHEDSQPPIPLFVEVCVVGVGAICWHQAYHIEFPTKLIGEEHPICHLETVNAVAALKTWAPQLKCCLVHLHTDNATATAAIFQLSRGRDSYIQSCTREMWLICAQADITLAVSHVLIESLTDSADALSSYHMAQVYKDTVQSLVDKGVSIIGQAPHAVNLSDGL